MQIAKGSPPSYREHTIETPDARGVRAYFKFDKGKMQQRIENDCKKKTKSKTCSLIASATKSLHACARRESLLWTGSQFARSFVQCQMPLRRLCLMMIWCLRFVAWGIIPLNYVGYIAMTNQSGVGHDSRKPHSQPYDSHPLFSHTDFSVSTWNARALITTSGAKRINKLNYLSSIFAHSDILMLQEAHGNHVSFYTSTRFRM